MSNENYEKRIREESESSPRVLVFVTIAGLVGFLVGSAVGGLNQEDLSIAERLGFGALTALSFVFLALRVMVSWSRDDD